MVTRRALFVAVSFACACSGQLSRGELSFAVIDPSGSVVPGARIELVSQASHTALALETDREGRQVFRELPFGVYAVRIAHSGFVPASVKVELNSHIPREEAVTLALRGISSEVNVSSTLLD